MSNDKLKPCPFCGGEAHWPEPEVNMPYVGCKDCGACVEDEVRWNTRAEETVLKRQRLTILAAVYPEARRFVETISGEMDPTGALLREVQSTSVAARSS